MAECFAAQFRTYLGRTPNIHDLETFGLNFLDSWVGQEENSHFNEDFVIKAFVRNIIILCICWICGKKFVLLFCSWKKKAISRIIYSYCEVRGKNLSLKILGKTFSFHCKIRIEMVSFSREPSSKFQSKLFITKSALK